MAFIVMNIVLLFSGKLQQLKRLERSEILQLIPAVEASMLNYLFPVMIVLFAVPINGEKLTLLKISALLLAIGAAVSWGNFSNLGKRIRTDNFISSYFYTAVSFVLSIAALLLFSSFRLPDALAASLTFLTPFVTLLFIMLLLGESIVWIQMAVFWLSSRARRFSASSTEPGQAGCALIIFFTFRQYAVFLRLFDIILINSMYNGMYNNGMKGCLT